jgi:hypothetical protein
MVILSVAHGHDVVQGQTKLFERFQSKPVALLTLAQNHHGALVEDHLQFETESRIVSSTAVSCGVPWRLSNYPLDSGPAPAAAISSMKHLGRLPGP